ncbi:MAG: hypothetical protein KIT85_20795 [Pseudolabrys sp.]|nr:hypothetical protein [Pseudolabrys sp.]
MPLRYFPATVNFGAVKGGPLTTSVIVPIERKSPDDNPPILIALTGFDIRFRRADHHLRQIMVKLERDYSVPHDGKKIVVKVTVGMRDRDSDWDDHYEGSLTFAVLIFDHDSSLQSRSISFGMNNRDWREDRAYGRALVEFKTEVGKKYRIVSLIQGFEFQWDHTDHEVRNITIAFTPKEPYAGKSHLDETDGKIIIRAECLFRDNVNDAAHHPDPSYRYTSMVYGTVLFLPQDRYDVQDIRTDENFSRTPPFRHSSRTVNQTVNFPPLNWNCGVVLDQIYLSYERDDHHLHRAMAGVSVASYDNDVATIRFTGGLRDYSGDWDDPYRVMLTGYAIGLKPVLVAKPGSGLSSEARKDILERHKDKRPQ